MEKLEQEVEMPEEKQEQTLRDKLPGKKRFFRKNQVIITALAIMIAVAGYINYADGTYLRGESGEQTASKTGTDDAAEVDQILEDIESLDLDITDETAGDPVADAPETDESGMLTETPGEAVLTGASTYMAQARIDREQIRSQNKETLNSIINNTNLTEAERQGAVQSMVEMTELIEQESATELLLEAKGFSDVVVNLTGETADVVVPQTEVDEAQRAQIEDIVTRKTGIGVENIVITPMSADGGSDAAAETGADAAEENYDNES